MGTLQSRFLTVLQERPYVPFLAWCPGFASICPSLQPHAYASVAENQLKVYLYIQKIAGGSAPDPQGERGELKLPQTPKSDSRRLVPGTCTLRFALVLDCGAQIMVTLVRDVLQKTVNAATDEAQSSSRWKVDLLEL